MNKKAETTVLEVIIGIVIAGVVFTITTIMIVSIWNAGDAEEDSFLQLVEIVKELSDEKKVPGSSNVMVFAHKDESFLYPYTTNLKTLRFKDEELEQWVEIPLPHTKECEETSCLCLCQKIEAGNCVQGELFCEPLPNIKLSPGTEKVVSKKWYPNAAQRSRVRIKKCREGEEYCKESQEGDISIIFDMLDQNNLYRDIK